MSMHVHNLEVGDRVWLGDRDEDENEEGLFTGGEWRWWVVTECTEQPNKTEYHLVMRDDQGVVFDHIVSGGLSLAVKDSEGEWR